MHEILCINYCIAVSPVENDSVIDWSIGTSLSWPGGELESGPFSNRHAHRKICKNCLCAREEHDVRKDSKDDDQGVQVGKFLFSPTADTLNRRVGGEGTSRSPRFV